MTAEAEGPPPAPFRMTPYWFVLALIVLFALWPFVPVALANGLAALGRCSIAEAGPTPCALLGGDWGSVLWNMASLIKVSFFTIPAAGTFLFFWFVVLVVALLRHARQQAGSNASRAATVNFAWYGLALVVLLGLTYMVLRGWLPGGLLFLLVFAAAFWLFSFAFALYARLRRSRIKT